MSELVNIIRRVEGEIEHARQMIAMNDEFCAQREKMNVDHRRSIRENIRLLASLKTLEN